MVLYSGSIKRGSEHPSRRGRKLGFVNGDGDSELTSPEVTAFLESQQTETGGNWAGEIEKVGSCVVAVGVVRGAVDEKVEEIWVLVQLCLMVYPQESHFLLLCGWWSC